MSDVNPARTAARQQRRRRVLAQQTCIGCGFDEPAGLVAVTVGKLRYVVTERVKEHFPQLRRVLEDHHAVGRANDKDATVPLCRNCHALITEGYLAAGASMREQQHLLLKLVMVLRSLGVFFPFLGLACSKWSEQLTDFVALLDEKCPGWRKRRGGK